MNGWLSMRICSGSCAVLAGSSSNSVVSLSGRCENLLRSLVVPGSREVGRSAAAGTVGSRREKLCSEDALTGLSEGILGETATPISSGLMLFRQKLLLFSSMVC